MKTLILVSAVWVSTLTKPSADQEFAKFWGRTPCQEIASKFMDNVPADCIKKKWLITFFKDANNQPSKFQIKHIYRREEVYESTWKITKGTATDPNAEVYELALESGKKLILMNVQDRVLFFLDDNRQVLVGNYDFSYTLYRAEKP